MNERIVSPTDAAPLRYRLNILALPSQTTIQVIQVVLVMLAAVIAVGAAAPIAPLALVPVALLIFSFRGLIRVPEREIGNAKRAVAAEYAPINAVISDLTQQFGLAREPRLLISPERCPIRTFGSIRRNYILISNEQALELASALRSPLYGLAARAVIAHEIQHFRLNDHLWIEYTRVLLRVVIWLLAWITAGFVGQYLLITIVQRNVFTYMPSDLAAMLDAIAPGTGQILAGTLPNDVEWAAAGAGLQQLNLGLIIAYLLLNGLPFILIGGVFLIVFWRSTLRTREFYADAGAAQAVGEATAIFDAITLMHPRTLLAPHAPGANSPIPWRPVLPHWLKSLTATAPSLNERAEALRNPTRTFVAWPQQALRIGLFIAGLNILLSATSSIFYIGAWPIHLPVLGIYILMSLSMIHHQVLGVQTSTIIFGSVLIATGVHAILILLTVALLSLALLFSPQMLAGLLELWASVIVGYTGTDTTPLITGSAELINLVQAAIFRNLLQIPVLFVSVLAGIYAQTWLSSCILRWYRLPQAKHRLFRHIGLGIIGIGLLLVGALIPITNVVLGRWIWLASPISWAFSIVCLAGAGIIGIRLWQNQQHFAGRCPTCESAITGPFALGRQCPQCGTVLHPWLLADYRFEEP